MTKKRECEILTIPVFSYQPRCDNDDTDNDNGDKNDNDNNGNDNDGKNIQNVKFSQFQFSSPWRPRCPRSPPIRAPSQCTRRQPSRLSLG